MSNDNQNNGWSQYQIMVLEKLNEHGEILKNLNFQINKINGDLRVSESVADAWRIDFVNRVIKIENNMDVILNAENGINSRLKKIEQEDLFDQRLDSKSKAVWAIVGGGIVFIGNIAIQIAAMLLQQP